MTEARGDKQQVDFIGIGFSKCGSTWIYKCLEEHPEICCSNPKETMYFSRKYEKGEKWYASLFNSCRDSRMINGEFTPDYAELYPVAFQRIRKDVPDVKLIIIIRNQFERLHSFWTFRPLRHGIKSFDQYLRRNPEGAWERGLYYKHLKPYFDTFDRSKLHVITNKDIKEKPGKVMRELYVFLGVNDNFKPSILHSSSNTSAGQKSYSHSLTKFHHSGRHLVRNSFLKHLVPIFDHMGIKRLFIRIEQLNSSGGKSHSEGLNHTLSDEMAAKIKKYYEDDVEELSKQLDRNLGHLLEAPK